MGLGWRKMHNPCIFSVIFDGSTPSLIPHDEQDDELSKKA